MRSTLPAFLHRLGPQMHALIGHRGELGDVRIVVAEALVEALDERLVGRRVELLEVGVATRGCRCASSGDSTMCSLPTPKVVEAIGICLFMPAAAHWR